jgi:uncharacterized protein GlcG (DUF336 family)
MTDVENIISAAATRAKHDGVAAVIAVSDREGHPLGVFDMTDAPTMSEDIDIINQTVLPPHLNQVEATALEKARTAAFLSSDQDAFSTLTADTLTATHFPLGISNTPQAPLFGLQFSQLPCSDVQPANGTTGALGGIPLYKNNEIAGGIGIDGPKKTEDERIALAGALKPYSPPSSITANQFYINGFQLPWTVSSPPKRLPISDHRQPDAGSGEADRRRCDDDDHPIRCPSESYASLDSPADRSACANAGRSNRSRR